MIASIRRDERGLTLVELIVAIVIAGLFAGMLTVAFVNGWTAQEKSVARDKATGQANLLRTTMSDSIRNATAVRVSDSGKRVDAVVAKPGTSFTATWTWECRAWVHIDKSVRYSAGSSPRGADATSWVVLAGKSPQRPLDEAAPPAGAVPFTLLGTKGVQINLDITVGDVPKTVRVSDGIAGQAVAQTGAITCW